MNIQERKYSIIEKIMYLNESQLDKLESVLNEDIGLNAALDRALQQVKEGRIKPHHEVRKKYEKWL